MGWFDALYQCAEGDTGKVPWVGLAPNPNLLEWLDRNGVAGDGKTALTIGCGLGDDAEELSRRGFRVTAFDISARAIAWCRERFPQTEVKYRVADLLEPPAEWGGAFDFVLEAYTLQVLLPELRSRAIERVARLPALSGMLLVIARARAPEDPQGVMPWPLTSEELSQFVILGLLQDSFEDYLDREDPPVRRFRAVYRR